MSQEPEITAGLVSWSTFRYAISGTVVTGFSFATPIVLNAVFSIPLEACLPPVYVLAFTLQFTLQRLFVFRHVRDFALSIRQQAAWYVMIAAIQYPLTAAATAVLPGWLGVSEREVYVISSLVVAFATFLFLRRNVFHGSGDLPTTSPPRTTEAPTEPRASLSRQ
jgi:putative flippase GtrA